MKLFYATILILAAGSIAKAESLNCVNHSIGVEYLVDQESTSTAEARGTFTLDFETGNQEHIFSLGDTDIAAELVIDEESGNESLTLQQININGDSDFSAVLASTRLNTVGVTSLSYRSIDSPVVFSIVCENK